MVTYKGKNVCPSCGNKHSRQSVFCSKCEQESMAYFGIQIPKSWAKGLMRGDEKGRFKECATFSDRHGYSLDLVLLKLRLKFGVIIDLTKKEIYEMIDREDEACRKK